jgi:hypothetical protein
MKFRIVCAAAAIAVLVGTLAGCFSSGATGSHVSPAVIGHFRGFPTGVTVPAGRNPGQSTKPWAAWASPRSIYVMTRRSGSCPNIPSSVEASGTDRVVIKTVEHDFYKGDTACTADLAVTTSVVRLPLSIDTTSRWQRRLTGRALG